jgi:hypothetical protein
MRAISLSSDSVDHLTVTADAVRGGTLVHVAIFSGIAPAGSRSRQRQRTIWSVHNESPTQADAMKERASAPGGCWKVQSIRLHQAREAHDDGSI